MNLGRGGGRGHNFMIFLNNGFPNDVPKALPSSIKQAKAQFVELSCEKSHVKGCRVLSLNLGKYSHV